MLKVLMDTKMTHCHKHTQCKAPTSQIKPNMSQEKSKTNRVIDEQNKGNLKLKISVKKNSHYVIM